MLVPKLFTCLKNYNKELFVKDLIAGIIVAIIALPLAIALAIASGVSPEIGLHTAIIGGFIISFLGGSKVQIGGPTGAFIILVYGIIQEHGITGLTIATLIAGVFLMLMGVLRLGSVIKFIPYPITTGFTCGIAITIFSTQIKDFFGLSIAEVPSEFVEKWGVYVKQMSTTNLVALGIGALSLIIIVFWPRVNKKIPGTLIAIILTTILTTVFNLDAETIGSRFGSISQALPHVMLPKISIAMVKDLIGPGFTIAVLAALESLLCAVVADEMIEGNHRSDMELIAQGAANVCSALFGGIPVTGAIARTAANVKNGAATPVSGIIHAITLLIIMLICMPYVKLVPMASLAAILIVVSYNMGEWDVFKTLKKAPKSDAIVFLVTFGLTIFMDLVAAIGVGVVLSAFLFMKRMADVTEIKCDELEEREKNYIGEVIIDAEIGKDISFFEINGPMFYAAANKFIDSIKEIENVPKIIVLKMGRVPAIDATAYNGFERLAELCQDNNTNLILCDIQPQPLKMLRKYGFVNVIGEDNLCNTFRKAVLRANKLLDIIKIKEPISLT